jgi:hypothetical protein
MTAQEVLDFCFRRFVFVKQVGGNIELEALFPNDFPISDDLIDLVRRHKPEVLALLGWHEEADRLLLESTRRLAHAWPEGYPLEGPEWEAHEQALHDAYHSGDACRLSDAIRAREDFALVLFDRYRKKVTR